jgi:hypothetical protein
MRNPMIDPFIWNRSFFAWLILVFGIINLIMAITLPITTTSYFNFIVFGFCFGIWLFNSIITRQFLLIGNSIALNYKLMDLINKLMYEHYDRNN